MTIMTKAICINSRNIKTKSIKMNNSTLFKRLTLGLCFLLFSLGAQAVTKTATGAAWNVAGNWSPAGIPAAGDSVIIPSGVTMSLNQNSGALLALNVQSGGTLNVAAGFTLATTGTFTNAGTFTGNNQTITVGKYFVNSGGFTSTTNVFSIAEGFTNTGTFTPNGGTVTFNGTGNQNLNVGGSGTLTFFNLTINTTPAASNNVVTMGTAVTVTNTLTLTAGILDVSASNYPLTVYKTFTNNSTSTTGAYLGFNPENGTVDLGNAGNNVTLNGGQVTTFYNLSSDAGVGNTVTANTVNWNVLNNLTVSTGSLLTGNRTNVVGGSVYINSGATYTYTGGTLTLTGNLDNYGTFTLGAGNLNLASNLINNGTWTAPTGGTTTFNGTSAQAIRGVPASLWNFTINSSAQANVITLDTSVTVLTNLTLTSGTFNTQIYPIDAVTAGTGRFTSANGSTLILGVQSNATAVAFPNFALYTVNATSNTYYEANASETILNSAAFNYGNLYLLGGTGANVYSLSAPNTAFNIAGNLTVGNATSGGITFSLTGSANIVLNGAIGLGNINIGTDGIINNSTGTGNITSNNGNLTNHGSILFAASNLAINGANPNGVITNSGSITFSGAGTLTSVGGGVSNSGTINFSGGGTLTVTGAAAAGGGQSVINTGTLEYTGAGGALNIQGNFNTTGGTWICGTSTVTFNGSAAQATNQTISATTTSPLTFYNLTCDNGVGFNVVLADSIVVTAPTAQTGLDIIRGGLDVGSGSNWQVRCLGNFQNNSVAVTSFVPENGLVILGGTGNLVGACTFYNLTVDPLSGNTVTVTTNNQIVNNNLYVESGTLSTGARNWTVSGTLTNNGTISATTAALAITGAVTNTGAISWTGTGAFTVSNAINNSGTISCGAAGNTTITLTGASGNISNTGTGAITWSAGGAWTISGNVTSSSTASPAIATATGNVSVTGNTTLTAGTMSLGSGTYTSTGTFGDSAGTTVSFSAAGTLTVTGNMVNSGTLTLNTANLKLGGNFINEGTFTTPTAGLTTFNTASGTQYIGGAHSPTFFNLTTNPAAASTVNLYVPIGVNNNMTITTGTVACNTDSIVGPGSGSGTFTMNNGTSFILGLESAATRGNILTFLTTTLNATSTVTYQANTAQTIAIVNYNNLNIYTGAATTTATLASGTNFNITGNLVIGDGVSAGTVTLNVPLTNTITLTAASPNGNATINTNGALNFVGGATLTLNNGNLTNSGTITSAGGETFNVGGFFTNNGTWTASGGGNFTIAGNFTNGGTTTFSGGGNLILRSDFSNTGTYTCGTSTVFMSGTAGLNHNQNINSSTALTFYNLEPNNAGTTINTVFLNQNINVSFNLNVNQGIFNCQQYTVTGNTSGTMTLNNFPGTTFIYGSPTVATANTFPSFAAMNFGQSSTVIYEANANQTILVKSAVSPFVVVNYGNLDVYTGTANTTNTLSAVNAFNINGSTGLTVGNGIATGIATLQIATNAITLNNNATGGITIATDGNITFTGAGSFTLYGNFVNNSTGAGFVPGTSTVTFNATAGQNQNQNISGTAAVTNFYKLTQNNNGTFPTNELVLGNTATVSNTLTFTKGLIVLGSNNLTLTGTAAAVAGAGATAYVVTNGTGTLSKIYTATGAYNFPVGDNAAATDYTPMSINVTAGTGTVNVLTVNSKEPHNASSVNYLNRYWTISQSGGVTAQTSTGTYLVGDVAGTEASIASGAWTGALPWTKYAVVNTGTHQTTTTAFGDITGITLAAPTVSISPTTVCASANTITATPVGDPTFTYTWGGLGTGTASTTAATATGSYNVSATDGNGFIATNTVTVTVQSPSSSLSSAVGTDAQTVCQNSAITNITYSIGGTATGATVSGLPTGVSGAFAAGTETISGTPTAAPGAYTYTVTSSGGACGAATSTGTITIQNATNSLSSAVGTDGQTICTGSAITNITYAIGGTATGATVAGLPTGVSGAFAAGTETISGTATGASGVYTYTVTTTGGSCTAATATGTITLHAPSISLSSAVGTDAQTTCVSTAITNITYSVGGTATGASVAGLPTGVSGAFAAGTETISGTPTAANGTYTYTVTTTGGACGTTSISGTITIQSSTVSLTSGVGTNAQTVCVNTAISNITYGIGGTATIIC